VASSDHPIAATDGSHEEDLIVQTTAVTAVVMSKDEIDELFGSSESVRRRWVSAAGPP